MKKQDYEQLTFLAVDSHANRSALPGSEAARTMTVISGLRCAESYGNSGPLGSLVRTCLASSIWHSTRCLLTWKRKDMKSSRFLFQLAVSMPRTEETESVFWPTPMASSWGGTGHRKTLKALRDKGLITEEERLALQQGNQIHTHPGLLEWLMGYEQQFTVLLPTPIASACKGGSTSRCWGSQIVHVEREREREREQEKGKGSLRQSTPKPCGSHSSWTDWPDEPGVGRVADGVPNRVDRIKCLGNAVVPQQFYIFFKLMADIEREKAS